MLKKSLKKNIYVSTVQTLPKLQTTSTQLVLPQIRNKTVETTLFLNSSSYLPAVSRLQSCRERIEVRSLDE